MNECPFTRADYYHFCGLFSRVFYKVTVLKAPSLCCFHRGELLLLQLNQVIDDHFRLGDIGITGEFGDPVLCRISLC